MNREGLSQDFLYCKLVQARLFSFSVCPNVSAVHREQESACYFKPAIKLTKLQIQAFLIQYAALFKKTVAFQLLSFSFEIKQHIEK